MKMKKLLAVALATAMCVPVAPAAYAQNEKADAAGTQGMVFQFRMEELQDGNKIVNSVDGKTYTVEGNTQELADSKKGEGKALKFDGTTYVNLGTEFQPENAYTMMGWFRQDAGATDGQALFSRGNSGNVAHQLAVMTKNSTIYHTVSVGASNSNFDEMISAANGPAEQWNHFAVARDGADLFIYINGEVAYEKRDMSAENFGTSSMNMYMGMDCDGNGNLYSRHAYQGLMDEMRLYNVALSQDEIKEMIRVEDDNNCPSVTDVKVKNISPKLGEEPHVKGMLEVEYTYSDPDGDAEGDTKFQWYMADAVDGEYTPIQGMHSRTIILLDTYVGKYLKCEVTAADEQGKKAEPVMSSSTTEAVMDTEGNPLTDWMVEADYGLSHHFLSNYFNLGHVYASPEEMWDRSKMTWNEFVGQFDAEAYAEQVNAAGADFVILTLGQNSGSYCAPNPVYDKYMREAGLLKEGEANPKTVSFENDLPMKIANAFEKYGIRLMLYLPSNPPHSACWDETGTPNGYGYFTDYLVTTKVFDYTPGRDGVPSQKARKVLSEMVEWWSKHYGDKISGWWFDGCYYGGVFESQMDMSLEYNLSTLANAAKAGNPYNIVTFNQGLNVNHAFAKSNPWQDYTAGESQGLDAFPVNGRWAKDSDDCQNFMFGPLGNRSNWSAGWGCKGTSRDVTFLINTAETAKEKEYALGFDTKVNIFGQLDPDQYKQLRQVKAAVIDGQDEIEIEGVQLSQSEMTLENVGDRGILKAEVTPDIASAKGLNVYAKDETIVEVRGSSSGIYDFVALKEGETTIVVESKNNPDIKAECKVVVAGRTPKAIYDDKDSCFTYTNARWSNLSGRPVDPDGFHEYKDTVYATSANGGKATFTFEGTGFDLIGGYNTDQGKISISVDGNEPVIVDTSVPNGGPKKAFGLVLYKQYGLENTTHTVEITKLDGTWMVIDAARVYEEEEVVDPIEPVSKKTLEYFLNKAKEHVANGDTDDVDKSVKDLFDKAIAEGDLIMAKADATRDEVMNATVKLMYAIHALDMKFPSADKTALEMALEVARMIELDKYVDAGKDEFSKALEDGQRVYDDEEATQEEVDQAWNALVEAMQALRFKADKKTLEDLLKQVGSLDLSQYTEESVQAFKAALAKAEAVLADDTLSEDEQKIVDDAVKALADAKDALEEKPEDSEKPDNSDKDNIQTGNEKQNDNKDNNKADSNKTNAPKTGDGSMVIWLMLMVAAVGVAAELKKRKVNR